MVWRSHALAGSGRCLGCLPSLPQRGWDAPCGRGNEPGERSLLHADVLLRADDPSHVPWPPVRAHGVPAARARPDRPREEPGVAFEWRLSNSRVEAARDDPRSCSIACQQIARAERPRRRAHPSDHQPRLPEHEDRVCCSASSSPGRIVFEPHRDVVVYPHTESTVFWSSLSVALPTEFAIELDVSLYALDAAPKHGKGTPRCRSAR